MSMDLSPNSYPQRFLHLQFPSNVHVDWQVSPICHILDICHVKTRGSARQCFGSWPAPEVISNNNGNTVGMRAEACEMLVPLGAAATISAHSCGSWDAAGGLSGRAHRPPESCSASVTRHVSHGPVGTTAADTGKELTVALCHHLNTCQ